jgi:hypothetical protein
MAPSTGPNHWPQTMGVKAGEEFTTSAAERASEP